MKNKMISFFLITWILAALPLTAAAQSFDQSRKGSISVTLISPKDKKPMAGAELSLYCIAEVEANTDGGPNYICSETLAGSGISLEDPDLVPKLDTFVSEQVLPSQKNTTDSNGKAVWADLMPGLYFVKHTNRVTGFAPCASFLVTVPMQTDAGYQYHVNASPKTDVVRLTDITIKKVWNTGRSSGMPSSITVQLLQHDKVVKTAMLNQQNNWKVTYTDMPESDGYSVKEVNVPRGYTATYTQRGYVFTVTNTPSLAQTGQLIWPIPVFAMAGIIFLMMGFVILRKPGKENA